MRIPPPPIWAFNWLLGAALLAYFTHAVVHMSGAH
jgi:hypothetical protein